MAAYLDPCSGCGALLNLSSSIEAGKCAQCRIDAKYNKAAGESDVAAVAVHKAKEEADAWLYRKAMAAYFLPQPFMAQPPSDLGWVDQKQEPAAVCISRHGGNCSEARRSMWCEAHKKAAR